MLNKKQLIFSVSKYLIRGGIAIALALILIVFFSNRISKISNSISEQRLIAAILDHRQETTAQLQQDFKLVGDIDRAVAKAFPSADNVLEFIATLDSLTGKNSIEEQINFDTPNEQESSIGYNVTFNSNVFNLGNYLKGFETLPYFTSISSLELQSGSDWNNDSVVSLRAVVYSQPISQ